MKTREKGKIPARTSLLGFGCMRLPKIDPEKSDIDKEKAQEMIDYAYAHGVNYYDTAYPYHEGRANLFIGEALKKYPRESFHLVSKNPVWLVEKPEDAVNFLHEQLKNARNSTSRRLVTEAQNIVRERYMESEITLDDVCSALGVSNSYFSSIFKKEMGKSFISYLTDYRMDIAAEMILNTTEKSYTIAEKVGYLDANYFSYVFKKRFGMSPSKYRNEHLKK